MKKLMRLFVTFVLVFTLLGQSVGATDISAASKVKLSQTKKTIRVGMRYTLKVSGTSRKVRWSSSNISVAGVNDKGVVYAKKTGKATITAKVAGKTLKCAITVIRCKIGEPSTFFYTIDSVNGIKVLWQAKNNTGKKINYYTINVKFYNPVGDPAEDEIDGTTGYRVKYVGPVKKGENLVMCDEVGYYPTLEKVTITSIEIIYSDKTKETIQYNKSTTKCVSEDDYY